MIYSNWWLGWGYKRFFIPHNTGNRLKWYNVPAMWRSSLMHCTVNISTTVQLTWIYQLPKLRTKNCFHKNQLKIIMKLIIFILTPYLCIFLWTPDLIFFFFLVFSINAKSVCGKFLEIHLQWRTQYHLVTELYKLFLGL